MESNQHKEKGMERGDRMLHGKPTYNIEKLYNTSMDNHKVVSPQAVADQSKPHLLFYAHYYYPDTASTGHIIQDLAEGMLDTYHVTVICVVPSYLGVIEDKWKTEKYYKETINDVDVLRVAVPEFTKSSKKSRVKNILAYFFRAMKATEKVGRVDYVMSVSQPPILGNLLGVYGKIKKSAILVLQQQDLNPEQVLAVNYSKSKAITALMMFLDKFSCSQADLIITVGRDLVETLQNRFKKHPNRLPKVKLINNWIDEKEVYPLEKDHPRVFEFKKRYGLISADGTNDKFIIMYSGNIGLYYDLENLMHVIEKFKDAHTPPTDAYPNGREVVFAFVGAGSVLNKLLLYKESHHLDNVVFIPYQDKENLIYSLNAGDVHWCVNAKGIKGVSVPSKAYGIMAAGKPILGVLERGSEARCLIEEAKCGTCHRPGDYTKIEELVRWFIEHGESEELKVMGMRGREYLVENLTKEICIEKYKKAILES